MNNGREPDRLLLCVDSSKFDLVESADMQEAGGVKVNDGHHRSPLYVRLRDKSNGQELIVIQNHLARGDADFRAQQATGLREWARTKSTPIIAIGDYNFDYDFKTRKGNAGFDAFLKDGVWKWIGRKPKQPSGAMCNIVCDVYWICGRWVVLWKFKLQYYL